MTRKNNQWATVEGDKAQTYEHLCNNWLALGNEAEAKGNAKRAETCFAKAQYWLDRANRARNWH